VDREGRAALRDFAFETGSSTTGLLTPLVDIPRDIALWIQR
jgi:hypothetical protein